MFVLLTACTPEATHAPLRASLATASPSVSVEPAGATSVLSTPTATATAPPVSCKLLGNEPCAGGALFRRVDSDGDEHLAVGLDVPFGALVFSPITGFVEGSSKFSITLVEHLCYSESGRILIGEGTRIGLQGEFEFLPRRDQRINEGQAIAKVVGDANITGSQNVLMAVTQITNGQYSPQGTRDVLNNIISGSAGWHERTDTPRMQTSTGTVFCGPHP